MSVLMHLFLPMAMDGDSLDNDYWVMAGLGVFNVRVGVLVVRVGMLVAEVGGVVLVDMGEVLPEDFEPSQVFVALGLAVFSLGTVLIQNEIQPKFTHLFK